MKLALAEAKITIVRLLQEYKLEGSAKLQTPIELNTSGSISRPKDGVFVKLVRR